MFDVAIFTALGWERRAVTGVLLAVEPAGPPRTWRGRLADGASCLVVQTGIGPARAAAAAAAAPPAGAFLACGCAGALVDWLVAGDLVAAESVIALGADGRPDELLPGVGAGLAAWAAGRGFRVHAGTLAASPVVLGTAAAKAALGATGALAVEMESGALAAAARARGIPFAALRAVLDAAGEALPGGAAVIDETSGEVRAVRALAEIALRPRLWPAAGRLARRQRVAARRLAAIMAVLEVAALAAPREAATAAGG
ncbi:MAG TPA: hypothetical protein VMR79_10190 [Verrucomicrobiae bacterium]|nr:hypothetical protein [Verrucomicrobiae bacterium]